ncbi:MAG TPA: dihydroorotase, partial [Candidatus Aerophobetes bacterium]|nr:dihydroorotase [Candidatus Aerophobetes bacterium]
MSILIKRGMVVDPASHREDVLDILIEDKIIKKIGKDIKSYGAEVIDAREKIVIP